jgi:hypothetical protein
MNIQEMKEKVKVYESQIDNLKYLRNELLQQIADAQALFKVGDLVTYRGASHVYKVVGLEPGYSFANEPHYIVSKIKKDGTVGTQRTRLYSMGEQVTKVLAVAK